MGPIKFQWVYTVNGFYPNQAVKVHDSQQKYIIKANHERVTIPGMLEVGRRAAYISYERFEWPKCRYEVCLVIYLKAAHTNDSL